MSDIRRLNLQERQAVSVSAVPMETYKLGEQRLSELETILPELEKLDYWCPDYQAWEPFLFEYLRSGINSKLATTWLPKFSAKIMELGPTRSRYHNIYAEVLRMNRVVSVEVFEDYSWEDIMEFVEWIPTYIDNRKTILRYLFDAGNFSTLYTNLLKTQEGELYSSNLIHAVYLYRHCMFDSTPYPAHLVESMEQQLTSYVEDFEKTFTVVSAFCNAEKEVYQWYTPKVKRLISHAWLTASDLSSKRNIINQREVFSMPVWLSEQLTDYLNTLPCVYTVPVEGTFILDALDYALSPDASFDDVNMLYAFCIPKDYIKKFLDTLSMFYWDVKEGRFVSQLRAMVNAQYTSSTDPEVKTPEQYDHELLARGFPLEGEENG